MRKKHLNSVIISVNKPPSQESYAYNTMNNSTPAVQIEKGELKNEQARPVSSGHQQRLHTRPNVSAENARRRVKDQLDGGSHIGEALMGKTAADSFPNQKSSNN